MASKPAALDCQAILAQLGWLRALARSLGADAHLAEDLTQATFLTALEHKPDTSRPVRGWLRTVMRNLLTESRRSRLRREARETRAARSEASEPALTVIERAAVQKRVVDAVMALEEPYRTTVLLRFFEGLPPRKIASRMAVPVATVKTRLARALERLRARLDGEHGGDRRAWLACLLAPLPMAAIPASTIGVVIVQTKAKLLAAAAVMLIGVGGWYAFDWFRDDRSALEAPGVEGPAVASGAQAKPRQDESPIAPIAHDRYAEAPASETKVPRGGGASTGAESSPAVARIKGRVLDPASSPVPAMKVVFEASQKKPGDASHPPPPATSAADGTFEMEAPAQSGSLSVDDPKYATVLVGAFDAQATAIEPVIVVAPLRRVAGHVVDAAKRPLPGVDVRIEIPDSFRANFSRILDYSQTSYWIAKTDAEGRFAFESAPAVKGAMLRAHLEGYEDRLDPVSTGPAEDLELVLAQTKPVRDTIAGQVVDHAGAGVAGARVSTSDRITTSDEKGMFAIKINEAYPPSKVMAVKEGFLPAIATLAAKPSPDAPVILRLEGSPLTITGKVVDGESKPLAGMQVWIVDTTVFANTRDNGIELIENLLGGQSRRGLWAPVKSDDAGRFTIRGLTARDYRLSAMDPKTLALAEAGPVAAGSTDVVITLSNDEIYESVAGVVVSRGGTPIANVTVKPQRDAFNVKLESGSESTSHADIDGATTDSDGRFKLQKLPKKGVYLRIEGSNILPREFGRSDGLEAAARGQKLDQLRIEVSARCHFQVDLGDEPDLADQIAVLDGGGREVPIDIFLGNGRRTQDRVRITGGRTGVLAVPETAATVVFYKGRAEINRKSVRLVPGSVATVRP